MSRSTVTAGDRSRPDGAWNHYLAELGSLRMHYVREGNGDPLFLLHGWPEFWWTWHRIIPTLEQQFQIIAPDLRGFGQTSDPGAQPASADTHAGDILALADHLGIERFGIVSHDVGAAVAQAIARRAPTRLRGLFFFNAPYPGIGKRWAEAGHLQQIWYYFFNQLPWAVDLIGQSRETCRTFFGNMLRHWSYADDTFDEELELWVDNFMQPGVIAGGFAWYAATHDARIALARDGSPTLPKIQVPSRFLWGRHDPVLPAAWSDRLDDYFVAPEIEIAEEAGHFVHYERPDLASNKIIEFFQSLAASSL